MIGCTPREAAESFRTLAPSIFFRMSTRDAAKRSIIATNESASRSARNAYCESSKRFVSASTVSVAPCMSMKPLLDFMAASRAASAAAGTSATDAFRRTQSSGSVQFSMAISPTSDWSTHTPSSSGAKPSSPIFAAVAAISSSYVMAIPPRRYMSLSERIWSA